MFAVPHPWNTVSQGYEATTMGYLARYSRSAIAETVLTPSSRVLDVACGPGTLTRLVAPQVAHVDALDFSPNMLALLDVYLAENNIVNVDTQMGDGQDLPYPDSQYDAAFSMFGLMFFPDRVRGFSELHRVLKPGSTAVVGAWAPLSQSPAMTLMFGAIRAMQPDVVLPPPPVIESLDNPDVFQREMVQAGFCSTRILLVTHAMEAPNLAVFWENLLRGSVPLVMLREKVGEEKWAEMAVLGKKYLADHVGAGPVSLNSDAWLGVGVK